MNTIATTYRELRAKGPLAVRHGARTVVASRQSRAPREALRKGMRDVLARMVLAGMDRAEIDGLFASLSG